jgi:hypothetical protein
MDSGFVGLIGACSATSLVSEGHSHRERETNQFQQCFRWIIGEFLILP